MSVYRQLTDIERRLEQIEALSRLHYSKSTYTPTYLGGTTAGATTYTTQYGEWTRIGHVVFVMGRVVWTAATGTGNAQISLPFAAKNTADLFGAGSIDISGVTFANSTPSLLLQPGTSVFIMRSPLTNAAPTIVAIEAAGTLNFNCWYEV